MTDNVINLPRKPQSAKEFLQMVADELETDSDTNLRVIVIAISNSADGAYFRTRSRKYNMPILEVPGAMHFAMTDLTRDSDA
jgi:hypothetical protein